jgi:hypothetical protein
MNPAKLELKTESLPPSCLGPDGKFKPMSEDEHGRYIESALRRLDKIERMTAADPPGAFEEFMRGIDGGVNPMLTERWHDASS